jgi:signal transduction histidine kinase
MTVRILTIRRWEGRLLERSLDPVDSILIPYLLPALAGLPLVTAAIAVYSPEEPWLTVIMLGWALPVYGAIAFDVHRRRVAQELRREAMANQRLAAIGEISARIVHQSRHQVGLMGWSVHRLRGLVGSVDPVDVAAADHELDALTQAKDRLSELLTSEVLHESVTQRAEGLGGPTTGGLVSVVSDVCDQLRAEAERVGVTLAVAVEGPDHPAPDKIRDVVFNLVDNAIDAAHTAVTVRVEGRHATTRLDVSDDGPGIPPAELERVFEPFSTTKGDGTGMGLAIAEAVVGDLGGEVRYERHGERTHFVVTIPAF